MRVCVLGVSGSGKTTFASELTRRTGLPHVELDLLNWRPGWVSRYDVDFDGFASDVEKAASADAWVIAGGYSKVRDQILKRAEHVVWIDLPKWLNLWQVLNRSIWRAALKRSELNGNYETFARWAEPYHPIGLVWRGYEAKRDKLTRALAAPECAHLNIIRCRSRRDVQRALETLVRLHHAR